MDQQHWQKLKDIFADVSEIPHEKREAFLRAACGEDLEMLLEVSSLLDAHEETENLIEKNAIDLASTVTSNAANYSGREFGNYRIVREIGRGGMGAVFLAERSDGEFDQKVALKIVRQSFGDSELERRFRQERQILASLNHPNIAGLLDGGVSSNEEPFLAMEYVEGRRIDEFCRDHGSSPRERLDLFLAVCRAVSFAHQNLIVHRDIKPSNIIVTGDGTVKLLDFGIAKLLDAPDLGEQTQTNLRAFTPAYASPEQILGKNVTTASDVYSLGVVLFELLTGDKPFHFEGRSLEEIVKTVREYEPSLPSQVFDPNDPQSTIRNSRLKGDLDNIVMKSLRKEPERRYVSVDAFAEDIERHLNGLPITARSNTFGYRASKFFGRNRIAVSASAFVVLALIAGFAVALWQANVARTERDRAEKRFNDVRQLSTSLLFELSPKIERLQGSTEAREILVKRALEYLDSLANESQNDTHLQSELASAYEKIGDLQGNPQKPNLSDFAGAILSYEKANTIRRNLTKTSKNQRLLAENFRELSAIRFVQNDVDGSLENSSEALKLYDALVSDNPSSFELRASYIEAQLEHANIFSSNNQYGVAVPLFRKALITIENLDQNQQETQRLAAKGFSMLGNALSWNSRQVEAEAEMANALKIADALAVKYPSDTTIQHGVWRVYMLASSIYENTQDDISLEFAETALRAVEKAVASDAANTQAKHNLAKTYSRIGVCLVNLKRLPEAVSNLEKAEKITLDLIEKESKNQIYQNDLGKIYTRFGDARESQGNLQSSLLYFQKSADIYEKNAKSDLKNTLDQRNFAQALKSVGQIYLKLKENGKAAEALQKVLEILNRLKAQNALGDYDRKLFDEAEIALQKL